MSAIICSNDHFNGIEYNTFRQFLFALNRKYDSIRAELFEKFFDIEFERNTDYFHVSDVIEAKIKSMIQHMKNLNVITWHWKYEHHCENVPKEIKEQLWILKDKKNPPEWDKTQLVKGIDSLIYQIELEYLKREPSQEEKESMEFFKQLRTHLCENIVRTSKDYDDAEWWP